MVVSAPGSRRSSLAGLLMFSVGSTEESPVSALGSVADGEGVPAVVGSVAGDVLGSLGPAWPGGAASGDFEGVASATAGVAGVSATAGPVVEVAADAGSACCGVVASWEVGLAGMVAFGEIIGGTDATGADGMTLLGSLDGGT